MSVNRVPDVPPGDRRTARADPDRCGVERGDRQGTPDDEMMRERETARVDRAKSPADRPPGLDCGRTEKTQREQRPDRNPRGEAVAGDGGDHQADACEQIRGVNAEGYAPWSAMVDMIDLGVAAGES